MKGRQIERVQHPVWGYPAFPRHGDAPLDNIDFRRGMGIGINAEPASEVDRLLVPPPIQIQSPRVGIDFYRNAMLGTGCKNAFHVYIVARPPQQLPPRHVAENVVCGFVTARKIRSVCDARSLRNWPCTLATTKSKRLRISSG